MQLLGQRSLGIAIVVLLALLVLIKRQATGSLIEYKAKDNFWIWLTNVYNLFFLLVVNPGVAILLIAGLFEKIDPTHLVIRQPLWQMGLEIAGLSFYVSGISLMAWALLRLGVNYQLGGSAPRAADAMVTDGPYNLVRHPMYTAALAISLGLAFLVQSLVFLAIFCIYLVLIFCLIPIEEEKLKQAYADRYLAYQKKVKRLIPYLY